jgi:hypothetical protein
MLDTECWGVWRSIGRNNRPMLHSHKRGRHHISTQNLKTLGIWVTSRIYLTFFPFMRLNHSHLKPNTETCLIPKCLWFIGCNWSFIGCFSNSLLGYSVVLLFATDFFYGLEWILVEATYMRYVSLYTRFKMWDLENVLLFSCGIGYWWFIGGIGRLI